MKSLDRRSFLHNASAIAGVAAVGASFHNLVARCQAGEFRSAKHGYGPLHPVRDESTGLPLLELPEGFRYLSFGWAGDPMSDGRPTPTMHDGMSVIAADEKTITICRNHEVDGDGLPFADAAHSFDPHAAGGCTLLTFDRIHEQFLPARPVLSGTVKNCAGGPTPWGSWLTCEETVLGPGDLVKDRPVRLEREHGWIFEVPADGSAVPVPLKAMGRFVHEAVAIDPVTHIVYETEDRHTSGFYRFLPNEPEHLAQGGRLQMMKLAGRDDLRTGLKMGDRFDVSWVDIEEPLRAHSPRTTDTLGVYNQGKAQGAATFARLEGCWHRQGKIYIVATSGGDLQAGQVFEYTPADESIRLIFESPSRDKLNMPDNITLSPGGGILLCEDSDVTPQRLQGLTVDGHLFPFASNNMQLAGTPHGYRGDFRMQEWAGASFSPDGKWLFVNIQTPGVTFAITGPWKNGALG